MNDSLFTPPPPLRSSSSLTLKKLAAILASIFGICFGLCGLAATVGMGFHPSASRYVIRASLVTEALCLLGLLATGLFALTQFLRRKANND